MKKKIIITIALSILLCGCAANIKDGVAFLEEAKYEEAKELFSKDIEKQKNLDKAHEGMGIACFELGEYEKAADNFELALKNEAKDSAIIYSFLGACYMETGEYEKAVNSYKKALKEEDITAELKQEIQFNLTAVYENMGDWDAAKKQMDKYVKAYPNDERVKKEVEFLETR